MKNGTMSAAAPALELVPLVKRDVALQLIRADFAPVIAGLLGTHLGERTRRLDAEELYERLDDDLEQLRANGLSLPLTGQGYCAQWRAAGFLVRRAALDSRGETFELSPDAMAAVRFLQSRAAPRSSATESRLASIAAQVRRLAIDTDPDAAARIALLEDEKDALDRRIAALRSGDDGTLDVDRALERTRDLLAQAADVPDDFARVRTEFESLNASLRARIVESEGSQSAVIDEVFLGIDHIADSDAGRSFSAFSRLVLDPALNAAFESDIRRILDRGFAQELTGDERRTLRTFLATLKERSAEIHDVITIFARALRRYVQSQDYQRDRVLRGMLREAMHAGAAAAPSVKPWHPTRLHLDLSAVALWSAATIDLHDPAEFAATEIVEHHEAGVADLAELRALARETEIDFDELTRNVNEALADSKTCTVGEVLSRFPASQGVGSVVGLLSLAGDQGTVDRTVEVLGWRGLDGVDRTALVPTHRFTGRLV